MHLYKVYSLNAALLGPLDSLPLEPKSVLAFFFKFSGGWETIPQTPGVAAPVTGVTVNEYEITLRNQKGKQFNKKRGQNVLINSFFFFQSQPWSELGVPGLPSHVLRMFA